MRAKSTECELELQQDTIQCSQQVSGRAMLPSTSVPATAKEYPSLLSGLAPPDKANNALHSL